MPGMSLPHPQRTHVPPARPDVRIVHFNDVYNICPGSHEPVGGAAKFQTVVEHYRSSPEFEGQTELLTLFSGDAFNPSLESIFTRGMLGTLPFPPTAQVFATQINRERRSTYDRALEPHRCQRCMYRGKTTFPTAFSTQ